MKRFDHLLSRGRLVLAIVVSAAAITACGEQGWSPFGGRSNSPTDGKEGGGAGGGGKNPDGTTPGAPLDPAGFTLAVAPVLEKEGCMECHHAGRPIDLTRYPFMAGTANETADALIASFGKDMPPAPRDRSPSSVVDKVTAWKAAGMKP